MRACPIATNYFSHRVIAEGVALTWSSHPPQGSGSFYPMASLTWFQMAANAWSITASVLGSYMSSRAPDVTLPRPLLGICTTNSAFPQYFAAREF